MRGHEALIAMRQAGKRPQFVSVNDYDCEAAKDWHDPGEKLSESWPMDAPTVSVKGDPIDLLDLRFLVGLTVMISSESEHRARQIFAAAKRAGASVIGACAVDGSSPIHTKTGYCEVWKRGVNHG